MVEHILVPTDGSDNSYGALEQAIEIATPLEAAVHVLTVVPEMTRGAKLREEWADRVDEAVETGRERVEQAGLAFTGATREGPVARQIVEYAEQNDIDMIVMGTHGRTGLHRFLVGSVAQRTIQTAPIPVLTVPPEE